MSIIIAALGGALAAPTLTSIEGDGGALICVDRPLSARYALERSEDGETWTEVPAVPGQAAWAGALGEQWRLRHRVSEEIVDAAVIDADLTLVSTEDRALYEDGDAALLSVSIAGEAAAVDGPPLSLLLSRADDGGLRWLDGACLGGGLDASECWSASPVALYEGLELTDLAELSLPALDLPEETDAGRWRLSAGLRWQPPRGRALDLDRSSLDLYTTGSRAAWGDLHAHTNLSYDACEDPETDCGEDGDAPAADFYARAVDNGLDFAAMTDHSEYLEYFPDAGELGTSYVIWDEANALAADAEAAYEGFVPLVGYEWTDTGVLTSGGTYSGGHRTVVFRELDACEDYRIGAWSNARQGRTQTSGFYLGNNPFVADGTDALRTAFDDAAASCGEEPLVSYFHHPAYGRPQSVDWDHWESDPDYEILVEIYSEHGSSECADETDTYCDFSINPLSDFTGDGSVQTALATGFRLGFVAGTDGHDADPGSLDDGPSYTDFWVDTDGDGINDSPATQYSAGGLTGALAAEALTRETLFEALEARRTMVTTGPRPAVRALAWGADGVAYPPGAEVPLEAMPLRVFVEIDGDDLTVSAIQVVDPTNAALLESEADTLEGDLDLASGDAAYVRVIATWGEDDARIWTSPWFAR
jgi:hypothetical protein